MLGLGRSTMADRLLFEARDEARLELPHDELRLRCAIDWVLAASAITRGTSHFAGYIGHDINDSSTRLCPGGTYLLSEVGGPADSRRSALGRCRRRSHGDPTAADCLD